MSNNKKIILQSAKNTSIFFIGSVLSKVISFFLLPIYTTYISKSGMGFYDLVQTYLGILVPLIFVELWSGSLRFLYLEKENEIAKKTIVSNSALIFFGSIFVFLLISVIGNILFSINYLCEIIILGITTAFGNMYQFLARGYQQNISFAISGLINTIVMSISNLILILVFHLDERSLIISLSLGYLFQVIYLEYKLKIRNKLSIKLIDFSVVKKLLNYSLPLGFNSISYWLLSSSGKLAIKHFISIEANGIYAVSQKFAMLINFAMMAVNYAWQDIAFSDNSEDKGKFYSNAMRIYMFILAYGLILLYPAIYVVSPFFIRGSFSIAIQFIPLGLIASMLLAFATILGNIFGALRKTKQILTTTIIAAILNVILSIILVDRKSVV